MSDRYLLPAELRRGATFGEAWESQALVEKNGGVLVGGAVVTFGKLTTIGDGGVTYNGQDLSNFINNGGSIKIQRFCYTGSDANFGRFFEWRPDADNGIVAGIRNSDGELRCSIEKATTITGADIETGTLIEGKEYDLIIDWDGTSTIKLYVNGVDERDGTDTLGFATADSKIYASRSFIGSIGDITIFQGTQLTQQEALDYANNSTFNYGNEALVDLTMGMEQHDPDNNRTLDVSGNGRHAIFGDDSTSSTFPTKTAKTGYSNTLNKYLDINTILPSAKYTVGMLVVRTGGGYHQFFMDARANGGTGYIWANSANPIISPSSGTVYINGVANASYVMPNTGVFTLIVSGITLNVTQDIIIGAKNDASSSLYADVKRFKLTDELTETQVLDLHLNMMDKFNNV